MHILIVSDNVGIVIVSGTASDMFLAAVEMKKMRQRIVPNGESFAAPLSTCLKCG